MNSFRADWLTSAPGAIPGLKLHNELQKSQEGDLKVQEKTLRW